MAPLDRVGQLQEAMTAEGVDALVLRLTENIVLTTGWYVQWPGLCMAVIPKTGAASLLVPEYEASEAEAIWPGDVRTFPIIRQDRPPAGPALAELLRELAREHAAVGGAIGFEGSFESLGPGALAGEPNAVGLPTQALIKETFSAERLVDMTEALESIRAVKSDHDLQKLRTVNEIAMLGLNAFKEHSRAGRREVEIAAAVEGAIFVDGHGHNGARVVRGYATVYSGPDLADGWQLFRSRTRVVEPNDVVMVEMGTVADGYWCDHTRVVVAGKATADRRRAYEAARSAGTAAFAAAVPGSAGSDVDAAARARCLEAGFKQFPHHTGHGLGFRYHESRPLLGPTSDHVLEENMVVAVEPGIYESSLNGGFRHEDNAYVTREGAVLLASTDYDLD